MGPAGAVVVAILATVVGCVGATLAIAAWVGMRGGARDAAARWARVLLPVGLVDLALGVLLPKARLVSLEFESTGRLVMLGAAVAGAAASALAVRRSDPGSMRALLCHLYFGWLALSPLGAFIFGIFRTP